MELSRKAGRTRPGGALWGSEQRSFVFILVTVGSNWSVSSMRVVWSDLCFEMITLVSVLGSGWRRARQETGRPVRRWL